MPGHHGGLNGPCEACSTAPYTYRLNAIFMWCGCVFVFFLMAIGLKRVHSSESSAVDDAISIMALSSVSIVHHNGMLVERTEFLKVVEPLLSAKSLSRGQHQCFGKIQRRSGVFHVIFGTMGISTEIMRPGRSSRARRVHTRPCLK
eukprot:gnl/MRDRNA2_/MRDRNA2_58615_c0_seq1.p1 gnl/MRDRNA2_/MRDRNA2_58615_c0~~gnl/MRDRNA2_/MRDRNA2_58615_c0_seq1.p1  ORF type:complete len:146 (+),score=6.00 gnl/MRDRNA2_/MRDRNA2_58615_c0_seq1:24-461(+)